MTMRFTKTALSVAIMAASGAAVAATSNIKFTVNNQLVSSVNEGDQVTLTLTYGGDYGSATSAGLLKNGSPVSFTGGTTDIAGDNTATYIYTAGAAAATDTFDAIISTTGAGGVYNDEVSGSLSIVNAAPKIGSVSVSESEAYAGLTPITLTADVTDIDSPATELDFEWSVIPTSGSTTPILDGTTGSTLTQSESVAATALPYTKTLSVAVPETLAADTTYQVTLIVRDKNNPTGTATASWGQPISLKFKPQTNTVASFTMTSSVSGAAVSDGQTLYLDGADSSSTGFAVLALDGTASDDADTSGVASIWNWTVNGAACGFGSSGTTTTNSLSTPQLRVTNPQAAINTSCAIELIATEGNSVSAPITKTVNFKAYTQPTVTIQDESAATVSGKTVVLKPGESVSLTAVGADADGGESFTYVWSKTTGNTVEATHATGAPLNLSAATLGAGTYVYEVKATDSDGATNSTSAGAKVTVEVLTDVNVASADYTIQSPTTGVYTEDQYITLKADWPVSGTTCTDLTHEWTVDPDDTVTVSPFYEANGTTFQFKARVASNSKGYENVTVSHKVTDNCTGLTDSYKADAFSINDAKNGDPTSAPAVSASPVLVGETFELIASNSSDPDGWNDIKDGFEWSQLTGNTLDLGDTSAEVIELTAPDEAGTYTFSLKVTDLTGESDSEILRVVVSESPNKPPKAVASIGSTVPEDGTYALGVSDQVISLVGSASKDPDGDAIEYAWELLNPPSARLSFNSDKADPTYTIPDTLTDSTVLKFKLTVTDDNGLTDSDMVYVNVGDGSAPNAIATYSHINGGTTIREGDTVVLNGASSTDSDAGKSDTLSYLWTQTSGPAVALSTSNPTNGKATFVVPRIGSDQTIGMLLEVTDADGFKDSTKLSIDASDNGLNADSEYIPSVALLYGTYADDNNGAGFSVSNGSLIALRQVAQSEYASASTIPDGIEYGMWEFFIKPTDGTNGTSTLKMTSLPAAGGNIMPYRFKDGKFSQYTDETEATGSSLFIDDGSTIQIQVKDGGSTDDGAANGVIRGIIGFGAETYTTTETTSTKTTLGGGALGLGGLLAAGGFAALRRRKRLH